MLTQQQMNEIDERQIKMQQNFRSVQGKGQTLKYLGKDFIVHKNVFWPFCDSQPLVESFKVNPGDAVLDVCTGSGVIAIFAAYKGAKRVVALDINPDAVKNTEDNVRLHGFEKIIQVQISDMFDSLPESNKFNVITGNLPFRNKVAIDNVELSQWDTDFAAHKKFFSKVTKYLKPGGRIYLSQANFGGVDEMKKLATRAGFKVKMINEKSMPADDPRVFYAFELTKE